MVLTHLHSEHAGGATHCTSSGRVLPTFTHARYIVQRAAWEEACAPSERHGRQYRADDFLPFEETRAVGAHRWACPRSPGGVRRAGSRPTVGHQAVLAEVGGYHVAFLGILAPTVFHWVASVASAWDTDPEETLVSRHRLFRRGLSERWWLAPAGCDRGWRRPSSCAPRSGAASLGGEPVEPELPPLPVAGPVAQPSNRAVPLPSAQAPRAAAGPQRRRASAGGPVGVAGCGGGTAHAASG